MENQNQFSFEFKAKKLKTFKFHTRINQPLPLRFSILTFELIN